MKNAALNSPKNDGLQLFLEIISASLTIIYKRFDVSSIMISSNSALFYRLQPDSAGCISWFCRRWWCRSRCCCRSWMASLHFSLASRSLSMRDPKYIRLSLAVSSILNVDKRARRTCERRINSGSLYGRCRLPAVVVECWGTGWSEVSLEVSSCEITASLVDSSLPLASMPFMSSSLGHLLCCWKVDIGVDALRLHCPTFSRGGWHRVS